MSRAKIGIAMEYEPVSNGEFTPKEIMTYERWQAQKAEDRRRLREEFEANPQMVAEYWAAWGKTPVEIDWDSIEELE